MDEIFYDLTSLFDSRYVTVKIALQKKLDFKKYKTLTADRMVALLKHFGFDDYLPDPSTIIKYDP